MAWQETLVSFYFCFELGRRMVLRNLYIADSVVSDSRNGKIIVLLFFFYFFTYIFNEKKKKSETIMLWLFCCYGKI